MRSLKTSLSAGLAVLTSLAFAAGASAGNYGTPVSEADVAAWNIDVSTSTGEGLPDGQGNRR